MTESTPGTSTVPVTVPLRRNPLKRANALLVRIATDRNVVPLGQVKQSTVLKLVLLRGLEAREAE